MREMTLRAKPGPAVVLAAAVIAIACMEVAHPAAQSVRSSRRGAVVRDGDGHGAAVGRRGAAVKTEEGYAAAGRRGAVVKGDEGYAAVGRRGAVVRGEDGYAAAGRYGGAVVAGEEGVAAVGRRGGVIVGERYESYEGWRVAAGVGAAIAVGTMLARPPAAAVTISVGGSSYWYHDNVYYTRVISGGVVSYQVVGPPAGAIIATLPGSCRSVRVGGVAYSQCGPTYYQRVSTGYQVVVVR
jgi:Family of unknown function (DUF6515)